MKYTFPNGFLWGAATSAFQIEGSPLADGATPSTWYEFTRRRGAIADGTNGDVACDHFHRFPEDIRHMKDLGLKAYRLSTGWTRIYPQPGVVNQKGLDFYNRLVDALLAADVTPLLTIFHLEEPLWLARQGGFTRKAAVDHLVELGTTLMRALGDRVKLWCTINEPSLYAYQGYAIAEYPPAHRFDLRGMFHSAHNLLLAHARLSEACRALVSGGMTGLAHYYVDVVPATPASARDVQAASFMDDMANGAVLEPLFHGIYPERVVRRMGCFLPRGFEKDLSLIQGRQTYMGINYYRRNRYQYSFFMPFLHAREHIERSAPHTAMGDEIYPPGIYRALMRMKTDMGNPPCIITENGPPIPDVPGADPLYDAARIAYMADHIAQIGRAIQDGSDCRGYFFWSLLDNFEWSRGLSMRCGLIRTDFTTQKREWKKSAAWYQDFIRRGWLEHHPPTG
ncbi:MAG TPA: family 1 glycosylhydrolase [Spirochaetia bacterium]|nr:family 1 glycosylhydrolase [Spirochaetia bacterium]